MNILIGYRANVRNITIKSGDVEQLASGSPVKSTGRSNNRSSSGYGSAGTRTEQQKKNAQVDIRSFINGLSADTVKCFTDGSCQGNPGPSGTGVFIQIGERDIRHFRFLGQGTNNIAELSAVLDALGILQQEVELNTSIVLCTDSKYVVGILTKNWKAKANRPLIDQIKQQLRQWSNLEIRWIAGHADIPENEEADRLANCAVSERS